MRQKPKSWTMLDLIVFVPMLLSLLLGQTDCLTARTPSTSTTTTTTPQPPPNMETCQCGVFLLGTKPLVFSAEAKPILSGMPVSANCSAREDRLQCASICRQLIETMSQSNEDAPLVQTVVLHATRALACQRFNESEKVPLPRTIDASQGNHAARLDGETNKWKFLVGPLGRSEVANEGHRMNGHQEVEDDERDDNFIGRVTEPKYLGGFYRWCDEHWIYAGVSLHEPLCCLQHLPKTCPNPPKSQARNGRHPRLIIRRCKNDDCSSEEDSDFQTIDLVTERSTTTTTTTTTTTSTTTPSPSNTSEEGESDNEDNTEQEDKEKNDETSSSEVDTINPFDTTPRPVKNRKPLNSTAVAEAFKFLTSLMDSIGYGDVVQGITSVLPASTAAELIDRVDVGGWVGEYQDRYMAWPREFSLGYCYVEYSLYNMANDGFTTNNLLSRLFKNQRSGSSGGLGGGNGGNLNVLPSSVNMNLLPVMPHVHGPHGPMPPPPMGHGGDMGGAPPPPPYNQNGMNNVNNYISPMAPPLGESSYSAYGHGLGNRGRVKRGVTVSRSYSSAVGGSTTLASTDTNETPKVITGTRRVLRKKLVRTTTTTPEPPTSSSTEESLEPVAVIVPEVLLGNRTSFRPLTSFVPTNEVPHTQGFNKNNVFIPMPPPSPETQHQQQHQPVPLNNAHYYQNQYYQYDVPQNGQQYGHHQAPSQIQRQYHNTNNNGYQSRQGPPPGSLAEFARPRRNPQQSHPQTGYYPVPQQQQSPQTMLARQVPPPQQQQAKPKDAGSLMNIANMLVQTAMASGGGGGGGGGGDQVSNIMQNAIPLVSQVASSPAIQNMVSSLVTSFLTPPQRPTPAPTPPPTPKPQPTHIPPSQSLDDDYEPLDDSAEEEPLKSLLDTESNEILDNSVGGTPAPPKPTSPPPSSDGGGMLPNMVSQMISTYVKYMLGGGGNQRPPPQSSTSPPVSNNNRVPSSSSSTSSNKPNEPKDVVEMISNVAKPFFMSYFGVVPDDPGFGKLRINRGGHRHRSDKDGPNALSVNDILTNDPDPGTGINDILFGSANIPETGNGVIDFGNRVVYAYHAANDAQHGMYCFKQYSVNKLWDYFRLGVRYVFKK